MFNFTHDETTVSIDSLDGEKMTFALGAEGIRELHGALRNHFSNPQDTRNYVVFESWRLAEDEGRIVVGKDDEGIVFMKFVKGDSSRTIVLDYAGQVSLITTLRATWH